MLARAMAAPHAAADAPTIKVIKVTAARWADIPMIAVRRPASTAEAAAAEAAATARSVAQWAPVR